MPFYTVLTRILGREPAGEDLPGAVIELAEDHAAHLVALGALELTAGQAVTGTPAPALPPSPLAKAPANRAGKPKAKAPAKPESVAS